jgi:hypothetical protein
MGVNVSFESKNEKFRFSCPVSACMLLRILFGVWEQLDNVS